MDEPAWHEAPPRPARTLGLLPLALALAGGIAAFATLPSAGFLAHAFVAASDRPIASPLAAFEGGGEAVVPNPVILRAASS